MKETFRKKLGINFRNYKILGACNPDFAHQAIAIEPTVGVMLPCNVVVQEMDNGQIVVSAVNPTATLASSIQNQKLEAICKEVGSRLSRAVDAC